MLRNRHRLNGVHRDLKMLVYAAAKKLPFDIMVLEGLRTKKRQKKLFDRGSSWTMDSRHLISKVDGKGHAVDLAPVYDIDGDGDVEASWNWADYDVMGPVIKRLARKMNIRVKWGGDFKKVPRDGPHWELSKRIYP